MSSFHCLPLFLDEINHYINLDILSFFHSNILPLIGSTGIGKTRALLQLQQEIGSDFVTRYASFPRLDSKSLPINSWPASSVHILDWISNLLQDSQNEIIFDSVVLFEVLLVAILCTEPPNIPESTTDAWKAYHGLILKNCRDLYQRLDNGTLEQGVSSKSNIHQITRALATAIPFLSNKIVLCLDEVGSLISWNRVAFPDNWNLYRSLRHASRNLSFVCKSKFSFLVVVSGTNTGLSNFYHSPSRVFQYRPSDSRNFVCHTEVKGRTIPPITAVPIQLDPEDVFPTHVSAQKLLDQYHSEQNRLKGVVSLRLALSLRPLWTSYFALAPLDYQDKILSKVENALDLVSMKLKHDVGGKAVAGLLLLFTSVAPVPASILNLMVESSFGNVQSMFIGGQDSRAIANNDVVFFSMPTVDIFVFASVWKVILSCCNSSSLSFPSLQERHDDERIKFDSIITEACKLFLVNGLDSASLDLFFEVIVATVIVFLIQSQVVESSTDQLPLNSIPLSRLLNDHFTPIQLSDATSSVDDWYVNASSIVSFPSDIKKAKQIYMPSIEKGWELRQLFLMPDSFPGVDIILPIKNSTNAFGILKIQVKSHSLRNMFSGLLNFQVEGVPSFSIGVSRFNTPDLSKCQSYTDIQTTLCVDTCSKIEPCVYFRTLESFTCLSKLLKLIYSTRHVYSTIDLYETPSTQ
ncbi:hypothetical protein RCL1_001511 [Eukaryota sp. TZLM3-RCL]